MRKIWTFSVCWLTLAAAGCMVPTDKKDVKVVGETPPSPVDHADVIFVRTAQGVLRLDDRPGPDGIAVQVHFYLHDPSKPLPVTVSGKLELLLFEGRVSGVDLRTIKPFYTWVFSGPRLMDLAVKAREGWGYSFRLRWGPRPPSGKIVTLVARYEAPDGRAVYSKPMFVMIRPV